MYACSATDDIAIVGAIRKGDVIGRARDDPEESLTATRKRPRQRATGIGGVFLRSKSPRKLAAWYRDNLGLEVDGQVATWQWMSTRADHRVGNTLWAVLDEKDREWGSAHPSAQVNYRVADLDKILAQLRRKGAVVEERIEESTYGRFGWATDPEGNRFELWEPPPKYRSPERHVPME